MDRTEQTESENSASEEISAPAEAGETTAPVEIVEELVEGISIDGMCGVY